MNKVLYTVLAASLFATASALAAETPAEPVATISGIDGTALVNQGQEFATAGEAQALQAGDQVMVMDGGSAQIKFADGCVLNVEAGSMVVVPAQSTCAGGLAVQQPVGSMYAEAVGEGGSTVSPLVEGLIIGGVVLATALIVDEDPESP